MRPIRDWFAGPGGWSEALRLLGLSEIGYEKEPNACATARAAGHERVQVDVTKLDLAGLMTWGFLGSPPCQAWSTAGNQLGLLDQPRIFAHLTAVHAAGEWIDYPTDGWHDDRSPLVLEVVRAILLLKPTWVALEQVPAVLPFWERLAILLRGKGYRVWTGMLDSEMYGVPQTRDRAILTASLDAAHNVSRPPATHHRYKAGHTPEPALFGDLLPCVSMGRALGWGMDARPGLVISHAGQDGGSGARAAIEREREREARGHRAYRLHRGAGMTERNGERPDTPDDRPAPVITSKARTATWVFRNGNQPNAAERVENEPSPTITFGNNSAGVEWVHDRPATTVQGDPRIAEPGHRDRAGGFSQFDGESVRITVTEAAILQSFRPDYPWQGSRTKQFEQIGNAIPPLLATAIVGHLLGVDGWQDICRDWFNNDEEASA